MEIKIKKVMLSGRSLEVEYSESRLTDFGEITDTITRKSDALVHQDFLDSFSALKIHYSLLCDLKETVGLPEELNIEELDPEETAERFAPVFIGGIKLSGSESSEGVVIVGGKYLIGRCINADAPKATRNGTYEQKDHLFEMLEKVIFETEQYLFHGKFALKQQELDFEAAAEEYGYTGPAVDEPVAEEEEKPTRKRKAKGVAIATGKDVLVS